MTITHRDIGTLKWANYNFRGQKVYTIQVQILNFRTDRKIDVKFITEPFSGEIGFTTSDNLYEHKFAPLVKSKLGLV